MPPQRSWGGVAVKRRRRGHGFHRHLHTPPSASRTPPQLRWGGDKTRHSRRSLLRLGGAPQPSLTFTAAALQRAILGLVDPPGVEGDRRVLGDLLGPREAVPVGHHLLAEAVLRDDEQVQL